jgi:hypothetical protein
VPDEPRQSDDNPPRTIQSILEGATAESIRIDTITQIGQQTIIPPRPRPKPTGIPDNIPFRGSGIFVGRQDALETLHRELHRTDRVSIVALAEMGGIGKTELAVQYPRTYLSDYPGGVCWLDARAEGLVAQVIDYAQNKLMLDVPQERNGQPLTLAQQLTWRWRLPAACPKNAPIICDTARPSQQVPRCRCTRLKAICYYKNYQGWLSLHVESTQSCSAPSTAHQ